MLYVNYRPFAEIRAMIGEDLGASDWILIDQERIDRFAAATDDFNDVHVDPEVGRAGPFGTTIAHGLLTMALVTRMASTIVPVPKEMTSGYYYGFDNVRLIRPVLCGSELRGRFKLLDYFERAPGQWMRVVEAVVEVRGQDKPALTAETRAVHFLPPGLGEGEPSLYF
ncbi:MaoC family dehydratase [Sphingobium sp. V4]|uniref:MaoC family dehydratase n=1 Tax=Sphingobium sp. V4 TaxID=3038927 RepID=UPI002557CAAD|nr:MaoC family dehydratase [Sphingobium sp. V4]WIW89493.1 MaoC family dehydratase [Sphingobium sp. V4]